MKKIIMAAAVLVLGNWLYGQGRTGIPLDGEWRLTYGPYGRNARPPRMN